MREPFRKFRLIVNVLLISEIALGVAIIAVAVAYQNTLSTFMTVAEGKILFPTFFNAYILAFQVIVTYLCSLCMWRRVWVRRYSKSIRLLLSIWSFFCLLIVVGGCATIWSLLGSSDGLGENVALMLLRGIEVYYANPEWKFLWDQLQYTRECCGVNGYADWMHASWMPISSNVGNPSTDIQNLYEYLDYEIDANEAQQPTIRIITDCKGKKHYYYYRGPTTIQSSPENSTLGSIKNKGSDDEMERYECDLILLW